MSFFPFYQTHIEEKPRILTTCVSTIPNLARLREFHPGVPLVGINKKSNNTAMRGAHIREMVTELCSSLSALEMSEAPDKRGITEALLPRVEKNER